VLVFVFGGRVRLLHGWIMHILCRAVTCCCDLVCVCVCVFVCAFVFDCIDHSIRFVIVSYQIFLSLSLLTRHSDRVRVRVGFVKF